MTKRQIIKSREKAIETQAFFTKFEVNGNYLPKEMQKHWGGIWKSHGPTDNKRAKDILACVMFFSSSNVSLYECLIAAGEQMKGMKPGIKKAKKKVSRKDPEGGETRLSLNPGCLTRSPRKKKRTKRKAKKR